MKSLKKRIFSALLILTGVLSTTLVVQAKPVWDNHMQSVPNNLRVLASYDMNIGGTQSFEYMDESGEMCLFIVTEMYSMSRIANGTYKIEHTRGGAWVAGFYVTVSGNKITSAYGAYNQAFIGNIISDVLIKNSSTRATYSFIYEVYSTYMDAGVYCTVSGSNLNMYSY